jgi:hypothetical protein
MDGRQQNINLTHRDAEFKKKIKETSQIQILHHNVQSLKKINGTNCVITI